MKAFETLQRSILDIICQQQNWRVAEVECIEKTGHYVAKTLELKIPKVAVASSYKNAVHTVLSKLGLDIEVDVYTIKREAKPLAILLVAKDPKLIAELGDVVGQNMEKAQAEIGYFLHERGSNENQRKLADHRVVSFEAELKSETVTTYYLFNEAAIRVGVPPAEQKSWAEKHKEALALNSEEIDRGNIRG